MAELIPEGVDQMHVVGKVGGFAVGVALALSGCANGDDGGSDAGAPPASSAPSHAVSPGGVARGGQTFRLGQEAMVPFESGSVQGTAAVTVTAVEKGTSADLRPLQLGSKANGMTPFYIHITIKNVGDSDLSDTSPREPVGILPDGSDAQSVSVIGTFAKCDAKSAPSGFTKGRQFETCYIALAPSGSAVTGAKWVNDPFDDVDNFITWKS